MRPYQLVEPLKFRRAPLAAAALWFVAGLGWARWQSSQSLYLPTAILLAAWALLVALAALALWRAPRMAGVAVAAVWLVLGLANGLWQLHPQVSPQLLALADNLSRTVEAHVIRVRELPSVTTVDADDIPSWERTEDVPSGQHVLSLDLQLDRIEQLTPDQSTMVPVVGGARVSVYGALPPLACGDRIVLPLRLRVPDRYLDPGAFQYSDLLLQNGIAVESSADAAKLVRSAAGAATLRCRLASAQSWAAARFAAFTLSDANRTLPPSLRLNTQDARMLNAMLFGDRSGLGHGLRVGFERTGSFHLFVVSGLHIALLAAGVFWLLTWLRAPVWLAVPLTILAAAAYTALTGAGDPALRSLVMVSVYLVARVLSRNTDPMNALGAAVLVLLAIAPGSLADASFVMTVLAIVAIAGIAVPLGEYTFLRYAHVADEDWGLEGRSGTRGEKQLRVWLEVWGELLAALLGAPARRLPAWTLKAVMWAGELALVGLVAELVMVLPMALYFHRATVFALPSNMVVIPVIFVLAPAAMATFLLSLVNAWLALLPGAVTAAMLHLVVWTIGRVSHLQAADVRVPGPATSVVLLAIAAWLLLCVLVRRGRWGAWTAALALPLIAWAVLWPEPEVRRPATLEVTAIDVGQGDSLLAVNPEGATMMIDAGGPVGRGRVEAVSTFDVGEEVVSPYLWTRQIRRLDVLVLSHAHTDHMGGMPAVLENFRPRELWVGIDPQSQLYVALLRDAARVGVRVRHVHAGEHIRWGSVDVDVLAPAASYRNDLAPKNDDSVVLSMRYGKATALLEGDAEATSEVAMLNAGLVHPVTLLKVAHHGSRTSSTQAFLDAAKPVDAVISVGRHNTFGHPRAEVIVRLGEEQTHIFRTDQVGLTSFWMTPDGCVSEQTSGVELPGHCK